MAGTELHVMTATTPPASCCRVYGEQRRRNAQTLLRLRSFDGLPHRVIGLDEFNLTPSRDFHRASTRAEYLRECSLTGLLIAALLTACGRDERRAQPVRLGVIVDSSGGASWAFRAQWRSSWPLSSTTHAAAFRNPSH
jgi:hypothetical protein